MTDEAKKWFNSEVRTVNKFDVLLKATLRVGVCDPILIDGRTVKMVIRDEDIQSMHRHSQTTGNDLTDKVNRHPLLYKCYPTILRRGSTRAYDICNNAVADRGGDLKRARYMWHELGISDTAVRLAYDNVYASDFRMIVFESMCLYADGCKDPIIEAIAKPLLKSKDNP